MTKMVSSAPDTPVAALELTGLKLPPVRLQVCRDLIETIRYPVHNLLATLEKVDGYSDLRKETAAFAEKLDQVTSTRVVRELFAQLSRVYHATYANDSQAPLARNIQQAAATLIESANIVIAAALLKQRDLAAGSGVITIGSGGFNWVIGDNNQVVLIAKNQALKDFDSYRLRRWCAQQLKHAGLDQPQIEFVGCHPVVHAIMPYGAGTPVGMLLQSKECQRTGSIPADLRAAFIEMGQFIRKANTIAISGYGHLTRGTDRDFKGQFQSWSEAVQHYTFRFLNAEYAAKDKRQLQESNLLEPEDYHLVQELARAVSRWDYPAGLVHCDPHGGNFMWNEANNKLTVLDWDVANAGPLPEQLGLIYNCFCLSTHDSIRPLFQQAYELILAGCEPDHDRRRALQRDALAYACLVNMLFVNSGEQSFVESPESRVKKILAEYRKLGAEE